MTLFLLFLSAQMAGNGIACLIAAVAWHFTRPRLVASRLGAYTGAMVTTRPRSAKGGATPYKPLKRPAEYRPLVSMMRSKP